jgi:hypothetical protein
MQHTGTSLVERDQASVWHPYAPPAASPLFAVESASGVRLRLTDGRATAIPTSRPRFARSSSGFRT